MLSKRSRIVDKFPMEFRKFSKNYFYDAVCLLNYVKKSDIIFNMRFNSNIKRKLREKIKENHCDSVITRRNRILDPKLYIYTREPLQNHPSFSNTIIPIFGWKGV